MSFDPVPWLERDETFSPQRLHAPMDDQQQGEIKKVCVIGGGIAGLVAAYELRQLGHDVTLLEATNRCGGRILTHHFELKGQDYYGEFGAMRIPMDHLCTWKYVQEFRLKYHEFVQYNAKAYYHLRGKRFRQWQPLQAAHPGLYPDVRPKIGDLIPGDVLETLFHELWSKLSTSEQRWDLFNSDGLRRPTLQKFDRYSVWQHAQGILPPTRESFPRTLSAGGFLRDEEWEYIGRSSGMLWREKVSYLEHLVNTEVNHYPFMFTIDGGMERLPKALQKWLTRRIQLKVDSPVTEIAMKTHTSVTVRWSSGGTPDEAQFHYVICAVPAAATARIEFKPRLPDAKYEALTNLSYQSAAKSLVLCSQRRWEQDGIFGGGSHTDMEIQECWYPSDNAIPDPDLKSKHTKMMRVYQKDGSRESVEVTNDWMEKTPGVSDEPGVLIAAYMTGTNARRFASLTRDQRDTLVRTRLEKLHPGIKNDIVEIEHHSWDNQSNPGGGAWATFEPGERGRYQEALVAPYPTGNDFGSRVFFAGEHLGISHGWIQSAIQTAQGAAWYVNLA